MTLEKFDDSARAFIRGAWPLCLIAMPNMLILAAFHDPDIFFFILYSLAGCMIFVRGFGLATSWPIYGLTLAAFLAGVPSSNEMKLLEHMLNFEHMREFLWAFIIAFKSALMALPFSLFFFDRMGGYVALLKIPLCVFFLVLSIEPTLLMLLLANSGL
ncbi:MULTISPECIES: hypothetical protein [unclassified Desulfovibrio]|uniref:hypothetical protein n=1 Tax=unclassified Desulfovibrio TaxID=2593640 RepID=UPI002FDB5F67